MTTKENLNLDMYDKNVWEEAERVYLEGGGELIPVLPEEPKSLINYINNVTFITVSGNICFEYKDKDAIQEALRPFTIYIKDWGTVYFTCKS